MSGGVLIIGAGQAGGTAAALLRQLGYDGRICLVGEENLAPYHRPPLSKTWLKGEIDDEALLIRPNGFYEESRIDLRLDTRVVALDRRMRRVTLHSGEVVGYDYLILATGSRPVRLALPGADLGGVLVLRSATDALALRAWIRPGRHLAIVGGGYIGLEVAAAAIQAGARVTVVERAERLLFRCGSERLAAYYRAIHEARGTRFRFRADVTGFDERSGRVGGVRLADGEVIDCDAALVGIGVCPNQELAVAAGLACARGILVDEDARTSDPAIFAIGDVSCRPVALCGHDMTLESISNAVEQARMAACAILARPRPAQDVPWNWSDQFDLKLQVAGVADNIDETIVRGDPATGRFSLFHLSDGAIRQVEAVNAPADFMGGKLLIQSRAVVDRDALADPARHLKTLLRRAPAA